MVDIPVSRCRLRESLSTNSKGDLDWGVTLMKSVRTKWGNAMRLTPGATHEALRGWIRGPYGPATPVGPITSSSVNIKQYVKLTKWGVPQSRDSVNACTLGGQNLGAPDVLWYSRKRRNFKAG